VSSYRDIQQQGGPFRFFLDEQARDFLETHIREPSYCLQEY
jgi:hypothetical protein